MAAAAEAVAAQAAAAVAAEVAVAAPAAEVAAAAPEAQAANPLLVYDRVQIPTHILPIRVLLLLEKTDPEDLRMLCARLGSRAPPEADTLQLQLHARTVLAIAKASTLRSLLAERGANCDGCRTNAAHVEAVLRSVHLPQVARHALPLFRFGGGHLFPNVTAQFHFFEGRYKEMVREALRTDRCFGLVSTAQFGTLARIEEWSALPEGHFMVKVRGLRRFRLGRQWDLNCEECTTGPLAVAHVSFFDDDAAEGLALASARLLAEEAVQRYVALVGGSDIDRKLQAQLGPLAQQRGPFDVSMWLSAACTVHPDCAPMVEHLLLTKSTNDRLERIIEFQKELLEDVATKAPSRNKREL